MNELRRRSFLAVSGAMLGTPWPGAAQQPGRAYRIGILSLAVPAASMRSVGGWPAFFERLRAQGYVEGQNLTIDLRSAEGRIERLPELAAELERLKPDVLTAISNPPLLALHRATRTTPIVIMSHAAVAVGLVDSLARPGGNVTGIDNLAPELDGKRLQLLQEIAPQVKRIAALYNPADDPAMAIHFAQAEEAARTLGLSMRAVELRRVEDFDAAFAALARERPDALIAFTDNVTFVNRQRIVDFALEQRLPTVFEFNDFAVSGGLMSYGPTLSDICRRAADYVVRIFGGAKPTELPVERPTTFELALNLKTARMLGITVASSTRLRADRVIE
jgi:putative tryptophan/tyrosine transport system substrate-binding protein